MPETNIKMRNFKKCAFCRHWNDPTNSALTPVNGRLGIWKFDANMKQQCLLKGSQRRGMDFCSSFEMKL